MCGIVLGEATWGCVGAVAELQLSSYAVGWCVGFEGGFWVVLWGLRVVLWGFEVAISCGVGCRNCAELG